LRFGNCRRVIHPRRVGVQFLHHIAHQASTAQQVATQLAGVQSVLDGLMVDRPRRNILRRPR